MLGGAAMVLTFDVVPDAIVEHDDWHTHEHLPERLSIPGFLRGSRWVALQGQPRYFVLYEVEALDVLTSAAYLERLDHPTPWTAKMMPSYRGMTRGFCRIVHSAGRGLGHAGLLIRFKPAPGVDTALRSWLIGEALPGLPARPGLASVHLLEAAVAPPSTNEQRIRGRDAPVDWVVLATGYDADRVAALIETTLGTAQLERRGATGIVGGTYRMDYSLSARELSVAREPEDR